MRALPTAAIALVLGAAAVAPAFGIASVNVFGLRAPEEITGFQLNDSTNFEKIRPGDGYGLDYSQSGWKLDVFIYDLKRAAIPDDVKTAIVKAEFERARADAFLAQPRGLYAQVYLKRNFTIDDAKRTRFQCAQFYLTRDGAKPQDGYLCVTSWNNKFVKFRLTTLSDSTTEGDARKFVGAWIPVLWGGGAPVRAETKPEKPERAERAERPEPLQPERAHASPARTPPPPAARAQQHHRAAPPPARHHPVAPRRPKCPAGYICEYR